MLAEIPIPSIYPAYEAGLAEARDWYDQAGMTYMTIYIQAAEPDRRVVMNFFTEQDKEEYLQVFYRPDGSLDSQVLSTRVFADLAFVDVLPVIDAPIAWQAFLQLPEMENIQIVDFACARMVLDTQKWSLYLGPNMCQDEFDSTAEFHLDRMTGHRLD